MEIKPSRVFTRKAWFVGVPNCEKASCSFLRTTDRFSGIIQVLDGKDINNLWIVG